MCLSQKAFLVLLTKRKYQKSVSELENNFATDKLRLLDMSVCIKNIGSIYKQIPFYEEKHQTAMTYIDP